MRLYGAHPFNVRKWFRQWELHLEVKFDIEIINPFYDLMRDDIIAIDQGLKSSRDEDHIEVVERDLGAIADSDGIICIIDGGNSYGTPQEMVYAHLWNKTVHTIILNGMEHHYWLKYHSDYIYTTVAQFEQEFNTRI